MDIKDNNLLILGANHETISLVNTAKELGATVHVTDYNPDAPAKKYCDYPHNIDCMDLNSLLNLCRIEKIDGVLVGVADSLVRIYYELCTRMNFICYSNKIQSELFTNKGIFNKLCEKFKISHIPEFNFDKLKSFNFEHPLFVKPVDGNSGKGMSICYNNAELSEGIFLAKKESKSNSFLIEKYMDCDDLLIYFTFYKGIPYLSAIADRYTVKQKNKGSRVCTLAVYPSRFRKKYTSNLDKKLKELFKYLKIENGVFLISAFFENDNFYLYDPGFRLQGEAPDVHIENINGFNQREFLVKNALSLKYDFNVNKIKDYHFSNTQAATIWILLNPGTIHKIQGLKQIKQRKSTISILQRFIEGDQITEDMIGTERQVFCRIYVNMKTNNINDLYKEIKEIKEKIKVKDMEKGSLIIDDLLPFLK